MPFLPPNQQRQSTEGNVRGSRRILSVNNVSVYYSLIAFRHFMPLFIAQLWASEAVCFRPVRPSVRAYVRAAAEATPANLLSTSVVLELLENPKYMCVCDGNSLAFQF